MAREREMTPPARSTILLRCGYITNQGAGALRLQHLFVRRDEPCGCQDCVGLRTHLRGEVSGLLGVSGCGRQLAGDNRALPRRTGHVEHPVQRDYAISHVLETGAPGLGRWIVRDGHHGVAVTGVLRHILKCLKTAEVDRRLDVLWVASKLRGMDFDLDGHLLDLAVKRHRGTFLGKVRRVDAACQIPQGLDASSVFASSENRLEISAGFIPGTGRRGGEKTPTSDLPSAFIGDQRVARNYLTTPPICPKSGFWANRATNTYADGVAQTSTTRSPCVKKKKRCHKSKKRRFSLRKKRCAKGRGRAGVRKAGHARRCRSRRPGGEVIRRTR